MKIVAGNRLEDLLEHLAGVVAHPVGDPLDPEVIVVPTPGMEKWIARELAERLGVWANPSFPFPRNFLESVMDAFLGEPLPEAEAWRRDALAWSIFDILAKEASGEAASYLEGDSRGLKRFQLARRLAHTFDQYMVYRPELLFSWEEGAEKGDWQAGLWRSLTVRHGKNHPARRMTLFLERLAVRQDPPPSGVPRRVSLFGVSALPPLFVKLLQALSRLVEVRLYLPLPSPSFLQGEETGREAAGHPLLDTLGSVYKEFARILRDEGALEEVEEVFTPPESGSLLSGLQADIFGNRLPSPGEGPDDTLALHSCSGRLREVEALKDSLLALFEGDPTLRPEDVAVLCPDLEEYASLVEAVFGGEPGRPGSIPFQLGERNYLGESPLVENFLRLLETLQGRLPASRVAELLEYPPLAERFGLAPEEVEQARLWIRVSGIRWGEDAGHRAGEGLPAFRENSWRWGLDRLLLGYAFPGDGRRLYGEVLPFDDVEGATASILGGLCSFFSAVRGARAALEERRSPGGWAAFLSRLLEDFFSFSPGDSNDPAWVRGLLASMGGEAARAGFEEDVEFPVFQEAFSFRLGETVRRHSFLAGGVHFASLLPMRGLPFRVICLLGMNDGDFPRSETQAPFDRIARDPRPGDRSKREDDRSLFLETLTAARERLLLFWVGKSQREGSPLPPSVVVSELLDVLEESLPEGRKELAAEHPLQPFSPRYFTEGTGFTGFRGPWLRAARIVSGPRRERLPFLEGEVAVEEEDQVSLARFISFFKDPARFFLRESLGLHFGEEKELEDREPLDLGALDVYLIGDRLLRLGLEGISPGEALDIFRGAGAVPPGRGGERAFEKVAGEVEVFLERFREARGGGPLEPVSAQITLGGAVLAGKLGNLYPGGHVLGWFGKETGKRRVEAWIRHLFFLAARPPGTNPETRVLLREKKGKGGIVDFILSGPPDPRERLQELLDLYRLGRRVPLLFFPDQASRFLEEVSRGKDEDAVLSGFRGEFFGEGEKEPPPEIRILYGEEFPLLAGYRHFQGDPGPSFVESARRVLGPFFEARKEGGNG